MMATMTKPKTAGTKKPAKKFRMPRPKVPVVNQRAIDVAKDVLRTLHLTRFARRLYFAEHAGGIQLSKNVDLRGDLGLLTEKIRAQCEVCLLGACVLAKARVLDDMPALKHLRKIQDSENGYIMSTDTYKVLRDVFGLKQCALMESAFEGWIADGACALAFAQKHPTLRGRVRAVMTNLIENGGVFVLPEDD